jgi:predicted RNA methylase
MNRRENLIETLHGDVSKFRELPELIKQVGIFDDETGCIDSELMFSILNLASTLETVTAQLVRTLNELLGPDLEPVEKKPKDKGGAVWSVDKILSECTLEDNIMRLPQVQFSKKTYLEVKNRILEAGGEWNGKLNGFTFDFNADRVFSILKSGKRCNLKQEFQYFATPDAIADIAVSKFSSLLESQSILEPSAGRGSLVNAVRRRCPRAVVDCYELMPENIEHLSKVDGAHIVGTDFCKCHDKYDRIIANPPFTNNQDIDHLYMMYERLNIGGELSCIVSQHWKFANDQKCVHFREWLEMNDADVTDFDKGEFKESGTIIGTSLVYIVRKPKAGEQMLLF